MANYSGKQVVGVVAVTVVLAILLGPSLIDMVSTGSTNPFIPPTTGEVSQHKFTLTKRGTATAVEGATVYAWYDWNKDGAVNLGEYPEGEIETLTSATTTGLVTTAMEYPIGEEVLYQIHKSGYEVETFARARASIPAAHDGSALVVPSCFLTLTDTGATRISINGELLVSGSTDYNYTLSGATPSAEVVHTATTGDAGITEKAFTHWGTGKVYAGTMLIATYTNQDFIDLKPDGYSGVFIGPTTTTVWYNVDGYFNDADVTGDERYSMFFNFDISAAGDIATIGLYNGIEVSDLNIGVLNTQLGTYEDNIDIVA